MLLVGEVIRPHGRGGLLRIRSYAHSEETFSSAGGVFLRLCSGETYQYKVQSVVRHKGAYLLRLEGLDSLGTAERYRGAAILVNKEALGSVSR